MPPTLQLPHDFQCAPDCLESKTILISGAGCEIGHAVSLALAEHGATVLLLERKERMVASLYDEIVQRGWPEPMVIELDMVKAEEQHIHQLATGLEPSFPALNGLIHMETTAAPLAPVSLTNPETWQSTFRHLLMNPMLLTRDLLSSLEKSENASVVFSSLAAGRHGKAYWGPVGSMLSAVENLSQTLADEYHTIRFNTLDPGKVNTAIRHKYYPAEAKSGLRSHDDPLLVNYFLYLMSDQSRGTSGQKFTVPDQGINPKKC